MALVLATSALIRSIEDPALEPLLRDGHQVAFADPVAVRSEAGLVEELRGVAATLASVEPYTERVLAAAPDLRVISRTGVGFDAIDVAAATRRGIAVCTTPGANHHSVADLALALILACARGLVRGDRWVRSGGWMPQPEGIELRGATVGVVGTGLIGREVVKRLSGFEPRILAYDVVQTPELVERFGVRYVSLGELLAGSDFVTLHAPLLPETRGLIGVDALRTMKPSAFLVNTARGPLVDERALAEALAAGTIAGVGLDVFEEEPLPPSSPLRELENVILLPHVAGVTGASRVAMSRMSVENAALVLRGETPLSCLNPEVLAAR